MSEKDQKRDDRLGRIDAQGETGAAKSSSPPRPVAGWLIASTGAALAIAGLLIYLLFGERKAILPSPQFVGGKVCAACHSKEYEAWRGSDHGLAMQEANEQTVLGNFNNARFTYGGITSAFFTRDGKFFVNTDGPDGELKDYEIKYTFGVKPLQQYLIELPGGRMQALGIAWDSRLKEKDGQRWFHLYPGQKLTFRNPLNWTALIRTGTTSVRSATPPI
jgi:hypothetical protein